MNKKKIIALRNMFPNVKGFSKSKVIFASIVTFGTIIPYFIYIDKTFDKQVKKSIQKKRDTEKLIY
jgi:hypothetical protein